MVPLGGVKIYSSWSRRMLKTRRGLLGCENLVHFRRKTGHNLDEILNLLFSRFRRRQIGVESKTLTSRLQDENGRFVDGMEFAAAAAQFL